MRMLSAAGLFLTLSLATASADPAVQQAQAVLKQQGFYYGEINGETSADTVAAIRRFQIRKGLQVTGELNSETVAALGSSRSSGGNASPPPNVSQPVPTPAPSVASTLPRSPTEMPAIDPARIFDKTPFEAAPPPLQRRVVTGAQTVLRRRGFYKGPINGVYDSTVAFSLRAFQSSARLPVTGSFDMETLMALGLLPGQQIVPPRRMYRPQPLSEPPIRGEWIREPGRERDQPREDDDR